MSLPQKDIVSSGEGKNENLEVGDIQTIGHRGRFRPVWPDLSKYRHFGKILTIFGNFIWVYVVFGDTYIDPTSAISLPLVKL